MWIENSFPMEKEEKNVNSKFCQGNTSRTFKNFNVQTCGKSLSLYVREIRTNIQQNITKRACNSMPTDFPRVISLGKDIIIDLICDLILLLLLHEDIFSRK